MNELLAAGFLDHAQQWISTGGYVVLFGLLFACGLGLPLPEDIPLLIAGGLIAKGQMTWPIAGLACWLGIIGGDCILYHFGKKFGREITKVPFIGKHVTLARIEQAERLFARYGTWVVAIGRLFAGIRGAMVVTAGVTRFNFVKFIIVDGLAALVSGGGFMLLGWWVGGLIDKDFMAKIDHYKHVVTLAAIVLSVIGVAYFVWKSKRHQTPSQLMMDKVGDKVAGKVVDRAANELPPQP